MQGGLDLTFSVGGADLLELPVAAKPERRDGLWQATCFEIFLRAGDAPAYREFNFSPSSEWAAYGLADYRDGLEDLPLSSSPAIVTSEQERSFLLNAVLPPDALPGEGADVGLTAVIVEAGNVKSYWALAHPPGQPDFHHAACFAASLPAPQIP